MSSANCQDSDDLFIEDENGEVFLIEDDKKRHLINENELSDLMLDLQLSRSKAQFFSLVYNNGTY